MCQHRPTCPAADRPDREAARTVARHPEQGWSRLCNGVIVFDDLGQLLPNGHAVAANRPTPLHRPGLTRRPAPAELATAA